MCLNGGCLKERRHVIHYDIYTAGGSKHSARLLPTFSLSLISNVAIVCPFVAVITLSFLPRTTRALFFGGGIFVCIRSFYGCDDDSAIRLSFSVLN